MFPASQLRLSHTPGVRAALSEQALERELWGCRGPAGTGSASGTHVSAHEGPEKAAIHGGRTPLPGQSGPRGRVLAGATGLPGSPHFPHAGSRARPATPLLSRPGACRRPRLCHVLAAATAERRPTAPHAPRCRCRHKTLTEGKRARQTAANSRRAARPTASAASRPDLYPAGGRRPPPRRCLPRALTGTGPTRLAPLPLGSRRAAPAARVTLGGRACARGRPRPLRPRRYTRCGARQRRAVLPAVSVRLVRGCPRRRSARGSA